MGTQWDSRGLKNLTQNAPTSPRTIQTSPKWPTSTGKVWCFQARQPWETAHGRPGATNFSYELPWSRSPTRSTPGARRAPHGTRDIEFDSCKTYYSFPYLTWYSTWQLNRYNQPTPHWSIQDKHSKNRQRSDVTYTSRGVLAVLQALD